MDRTKLEEANRIVSLIEGAEQNLERLQHLFNTEEITIMNKNDGGYVYVTGYKKEAIEDLMIKDAEDWLCKQKNALDKL